MTTWRIDEIVFGERHRRDLGDIASLAANVAELGLLHPIVIRPDGPPRQSFAPVDSIQVGTRHRRDLGDILLRRALLRDAQGRASTPLDATTAESEAMR